MLTSLYLDNFAIVSHAELPLQPGMTAITGETGAGKSILIDALNLVLGGRAGSEVIRHGESQSEITASYDLAKNSPAHGWLSENELESDGDCLLRRIIRREGNSRGFINGRPVTMQQLRELGDLLVDIHGQHEHQSLLRSEAQRNILDGHAGYDGDLDSFARLYDQLQDTRNHLQRLLAIDDDGVSRMELLRYQVSELDELGLALDDIISLEAEHRRLANASDLIDGMNTVLNELGSDDQNGLDIQLGNSLATLQQLEVHDPALSETTQLIADASIQVQEAVSGLRQHLDRIESNPQRLAEVDRQIAQLQDLARKHRVTVHELPAKHEQLKAELSELESSEEHIARLQEDVDRLVMESRSAADRLSKKRLSAAKKLSAEVTARMQELGMQGGSFSISVEPLEDVRRHGADRIEFMVSANPGQDLMPVRRVASGGELSRIALALQVSTTENTGIATLVFDEIDVGIGGGVAEIVGRQLNSLGSGRQVLCITHLAQVAAYAEQQLRISKSGDPVEARIEPLAEEGRVEEIARMMGGIEITEQTLAHAREMLNQVAG